MYNHHKRMLPKREDAHRTEFPANYYSTSSVYSYSPTSTSDCPEHGRSRRRTTLILVTSVVLATLGVLSIAGIAAYLGIISKNISNNASQYEESYLQANTSNNRGETSVEDEILYNHGRSKDESGFIDLTNSLSDTKTGLGPPGNDDLINHRTTVIEPEIVAHNAIKYRNILSTRPPEIVHGSKLIPNSNSKPNSSLPIHISAKPVTVIVKSTSTSSSTSTSDAVSVIHSNYYNPVDMISPPVRGGGGDTSITYFTEEPTSPRTSTRIPSRLSDKNRHWYPLTNSHSLTPSTTTQISSGSNFTSGEDHDDKSNTRNPNQSSNNKNDDHRDAAVTLSSTSSDGRYRSTMHKTNGHQGLSGGVHESVVHVTPSDAKANTGKRNQNHQESFAKRHGLANVDEDAIITTSTTSSSDHNNGDENDDPHRTTQQQQHGSNNNDNNHHHQPQPNNSDDALGKGEKVSTVKSNANKFKNGQQVVDHHKPEYFIPITPIISSERPEDNNDELLNNHKMPISFDRISPEFYDKNPWTPLLDRPNLDKRPRVDISKPHPTTASPEPVIVWNTEYVQDHEDNFRVNSSPEPPPPQNYYGYGHTAPDSSSPGNKNKLQNQNVKPTLEFDDNEPISHAMNMDSSSTSTTTHNPSLNSKQPSHGEHTPSKTAGVNNTTTQGGTAQESHSSSSVEETGGFRPIAIPSYTVIIPHIPNSPPKNGHEHVKGAMAGPIRNEGGNGGQEHPEAEEEDRNLNTAFKFDRVGLVELVESSETQESSEERHSGDVNHPSNEQQVDDNDHQHSEKDMIKNEAEDIKEEDYGDTDDQAGDNPSPTKIYKLDPDNVDIVPDTLGNNDNTHMMESQDLKKPNTTSENHPLHHDSSTDNNHNHSSSSTEVTIPKLPDPIIKSTTDLIMSTLGSLNLIKSSPTQESDAESKLRASDVGESKESISVEDGSDGEIPAGTDSPLFPPVRSYVSVNLPLRPKPSPASLTEDSDKQIRMSNDEGSIIPTASSLHKVLSMMMKFEGDEESRDLKVEPPIVNITKQNVNLLLAHVNTNNAVTPSPSHPTTSTRREQKSYNNRHSKIDEQFAPPTNIEHIPVPLVTESPQETVKTQPNKMKLTNVTINDQNSPVYKFVLRQGQPIEELLKEIFQNYTDVQEESVASNTELPTHLLGSFRPSMSSNSSIPGPSLKSLDNNSKTEQTTQNGVGVTFTNVKISHPHVETNYRPIPTYISSTTASIRSTSDPPQLQTSTSIVINQDGEIVEECPKNTSFKCVSTGRCIPSYLRCNFIKECPDNSDEAECSCADFLRANGNGRKLCDGVVDCADASDEYSYCEYCKPGQYICAGSRSCINKTQICDSKRDCPNGDDENDCVKIGQSENPSQGTDLEEFSTTYNKNGQLMVRKKGVWGKLCVDTFSSVVSHWEVKDLARAVCKALTFSDFESVERIQDRSANNTEVPYYELFYGVSNNDTAVSSSSDEQFSSESTPRVGLGFKKTECQSKLVVNVTCQDLQCGTAPKSFTQTARYRVTRIVGGANSMPGKWPWQAALYKNGEYQCGATLISSRWLLSAGHCFYNAQDDYWVARLGTLRRGATVLSPYEQVVKITHIFLHPQYQNVGFVNDVSLLRLEKEVNFTDYVRPVCLPSRENKIRDGRMCTVVGWGQLFEVGRVFPDTLQEVQLPLISTIECRKRTLFLPLYKLTEQMFCAGFDRGGRDACLGDSGGPMMCQETDGRWSLYGVTSNGYGCARANRPGVYTHVASYLDWIHEKMNLENSVVFREKAKHCPGHRCLLGECLDRRQVCNGIVDCIEDNGSDERGNCTTHMGLIT